MPLGTLSPWRGGRSDQMGSVLVACLPEPHNRSPVKAPLSPPPGKPRRPVHSPCPFHRSSGARAAAAGAFEPSPLLQLIGEGTKDHPLSLTRPLLLDSPGRQGSWGNGITSHGLIPEGGEGSGRQTPLLPGACGQCVCVCVCGQLSTCGPAPFVPQICFQCIPTSCAHWPRAGCRRLL